MGLKYGVKRRSSAFLASLFIGTATAILIQAHKASAGTDSFWSIGLVIIALAGTAGIYAIGQVAALLRGLTLQGSARAKSREYRLLVALLLFFVLFVAHKFSLAFGSLYHLGLNERPKSVFLRDNYLTREVFVHQGKTTFTTDVPFENGQAVVGYRLNAAANIPDLSSLPLRFKLTAYDRSGTVLDECEDILDAMSEGSLDWRNFEINLRQSHAVQFLMDVKPAISRFSARDLLGVLMNNKRISIHASWTVPSVFSSATNLPNVILISIDTLRADALGCYGYNRNTSPAIDSFAGESILFKNAFSQSTWTLPSHMSLLTGRFPNELFNTLSYLPLEETETPGAGLKRITRETLPEALSKQGYYCAAFTDGVYVSSYYGFYKGFHLYNERYGAGGNSFKLARQWIDENKKRRLFLFLHTYLVHDYKWFERGDYLTRKGQTPGEKNELLQATRALFPQYADPLSFLTGDWEKLQRDWYDVRVRLTDQYIKDFLDYLRETNLYDNSIIILFSDHGEAFSEKHDDGKVLVEAHGQAPYESLIRVPLIMKLPVGASSRPAAVEEDVRLLDIPQTVLALLGMSENTEFRGRCILPGFHNFRQEDYPFSYATWSAPGGCIREHNHKYIVSDKKEEFYDLGTDPGEKKNLASSMPPEMAAMKKEYEKFLAETGHGGITIVESAEGVPDDIRENLKALGYIN